MKKSIVLILALLLLVSIFTGCSSNEAAKNSAEPSASANSDTADSGSRTIKDSLGREVEIPSNINTIVPLGNTPRMIAYLGLADKVVGIGECEHAKSPIQAYAFVNKDLWADLPNVGTDAMGATDYYPEQLISVRPDVILCTYSKDVADDIQRQTGIPVVAVPQGTLFQKDYEDALRLLGDVCGAKDRAEEVISYINDCVKDLENRTTDIKDNDKPTVLAAAATFKGIHGIEGVYSNYPVFSTVGANDVAKGISDTVGGLLVDREKILEWNPEIIFFDSEGVKLVKEDHNKNPNYYTQLKAVSNGNLYQYPNSTYHWTNVEIPIVNSYYVASILYPEQFKDMNFEKKANEIFKFFLGADDYLSKLEEAGAGYGKVSLGER